MENEKVYVRRTGETRIWVMGKDVRPLLDKTQVQGWRLGKTGSEARVWFELKLDGNWEVIQADEVKPAVYKNDSDGGRIKTE